MLSPIIMESYVCIVHNVMSLQFNLPLTTALMSISDRKFIEISTWNHDFERYDRLHIPDLHPGYPWDTHPPGR